MLKTVCGILFITTSSVMTANVMVDMQPPKKKIRVRVTGYWPGEDYYTSKLQSSEGVRLKAGRHCATDHRVIPAWSKV